MKRSRFGLWFPGTIALMGVMAVGASAQQMAFTWDDLPAHSSLPPGETRVEIGRKLIATMKESKMPPVYGFVNGVRTEEEPASTPMLADWRAAGLLLGNHTWSHVNLNQSSVDAWEADLLKNEDILKADMKADMGSADWHWLRYPNLAEGDTAEKRQAARSFLSEHGYKIAGVTMSFQDYAYNAPYARCVAKNDAAAVAQLEAAYLAAADAAIDYSRAMSKTLYERDIPYVLLMHVGALDAKMLPRLLKLYRDRGFTFVRLEDAEKDPFYRNDVDPSLPAVPDTLEEAMRAKKLPLPAAPRPAVDLNAICR
jgi:peptidoglycan-N-acetylglucosamine deacetylase